ncbi:MAG: SPOR domain-containing protein, partial [Salinibacter sp.]
CSGASQTSGQTGPSPDTPDRTEDKAPSIAQYETFDPSAYEARPPERAVEVVHQVPERLLRGRAAEGVRRTIEGFRVQVFSARDQQAAQDFRETVRRWWEKHKKEAPQVFREDPPMVIKYSQPYYRVRIGAFATRDAAEEALSFIKGAYPTAFIAQGVVTVIN